MKALSVGVVGAGTIAREMHLPVLSCMPDVEVQWICDVSADRARAAGNAYGIRNIVADSPADLPSCDAVLLAIPVGARDGYVDACGARGAAILAEKPFAVSAKKHRELIERFEPYQLGCAYMRRFYSSTLLLRHLVRTAPFGALLRIRISEGSRLTASRVDRSYLDDASQSASGGILSELGCHSLDAALFITGARGYEIHACEFACDGNVDRGITANIRLSESGHIPSCGVELEYCVSWLDRQENTILLEFENSSVWTGVGPGAEVYMGTPQTPAEATRLMPARRGAITANQAFYLQWRSFIDGIRAKSASVISAESALLGTVLIEDLYLNRKAHA